MKRVNENVEDKESGSKKVKFFDEVDGNFVDLDKDEDNEESVSAENGGVDRNGSLFGAEVPDNFDGPSLDMNLGNEEEQKGSDIDLNFPAYCSNRNERKKGLLESDQYPYNRGKGIWDKEVVDLVSDDDDSDVEIIGYTHGYSSKDTQIESKDRQIESVMPGDGLEDLSLGLGLLSMAIGDGESNPVTGGEERYAKEEKGKASHMGSWLTLKPNDSVYLDLVSDSDESIQSIEPPENVEVIPNLRANAAVIRATVADRDYRRRAARELARANGFVLITGNPSSSQKQQPPTPNPIEQLGTLPGPFSDALKMVRERTSKVDAQKLIEWRPLVKNQEESITAAFVPLLLDLSLKALAKNAEGIVSQEESITAAFVPSLLDLSLKALAKNAEGIVSLEQVPDCLRWRLANRLCDIGGMNASFFNLLVEGCPTEVRVKNCSWLTEEQFQQTIAKWQTKDLRVLQLDLCGQCMLDIAFKSMLDRCLSSFSRLAIVSLRGSCRLSDDGLRILVLSAPLLRSINLGQCALLTSDAVKFIADVLGSELRELYIDECHKIDALQSLPAMKKFRHLEILSVAGIHSINDCFVNEIVTAFGQTLRELDVADCIQLTDHSLQIIGKSCADLCSLNISNLNRLTDLGMEYLANGCRSIQKLKLRRNEFSDEAVAAFLESSGESLLELLLNNIAKVGPLTAISLAKRSRKLLSLDVSWCRRISNEALGLIVDCCSSLKLLKIFGCRQITNLFLEGHSNRVVRIVGSDFTPLMDHLDLFEPEEMLLLYSPLPDCMEA